MGLASSRYAGTIGAKNNGVKFFFNFFFVGCVEVLGCGGAWVWGALPHKMIEMPLGGSRSL